MLTLSCCRSNAYLEIVFLAELEDQIPPFSCSVGGVKNLKGKEDIQQNGSGPDVPTEEIQLTATWPPSSFR